MGIETAIIWLLAIFGVVGLYYRVRSLRLDEPLDRTQEGWPLLVGIRVAGLLCAWQIYLALARPDALAWAALPLPAALRWCGVAAVAFAVAWLLWMFVSLGHNLTDTVVTRRDAVFVEQGPYRLVRNPMYSGVPVFGTGLGLALGNWSIPLTALVVFVLLAIRTRTEERFLIARFGDRYADYMTRVGRFVPQGFSLPSPRR